jgi:3-deoxy-D-manno-octulosonic-acid transferase
VVRRFYRKALDAFTYFFVQNEGSKKVVATRKTNVAVSGDTRFDRVAAILDKDNTLDYISQFKNDTLTIVVGVLGQRRSPLLDFINTNTLTNSLSLLITSRGTKLNSLKTVSQKKSLILRKAGES